MTVYVDEQRIHIGGAICCCMFADSIEQLHAAARAVQLGRFAFSAGETLAHYNVSMAKRRKLVQMGAVEVDAEWRRARIREAMEKRRHVAPAAQERAGATISPHPGTSVPRKTG